jgi:hypothetical protein
MCHTQRGRVIVTSVYLAGPMSGYDEYNFPAFEAAALDLRERGFEVYSPAEMDEAEGIVPPKGKTKIDYSPQWYHFLQRDIHLITSGKVQGGVFLPGWHGSRGARLEYDVMERLGLATLSYPTLQFLGYRPAGRG